MLSIIKNEVVLISVLTSIITIWLITFYNSKRFGEKGSYKRMTKKQKKMFLKEWTHNDAGIIATPPIVVVHSSKFQNVHGNEGFIDNYKMEWLLRDEAGKEWCEFHDNISLSDWEIIYGNNVHEIVMVELRLKDEQV